MNVDPQRQQAITDKIVRAVRSSKKFITAHIVEAGRNITVEVAHESPSTSDYLLINETVKFALGKWGNTTGWVENLYAALAYKWPEHEIVIREIDHVGNGSTTYFK